MLSYLNCNFKALEQKKRQGNDVCNAFHISLWKTLPFVGRFFHLFGKRLSAAAQVAFFTRHLYVDSHAAFTAFPGH